MRYAGKKWSSLLGDGMLNLCGGDSDRRVWLRRQWGAGLNASGTPPAPTNLTASAGNAQVSLSWTASTGATSYNVRRSTTNGGPYAVIGSPTTTSYTDSGLTNGQTYYYVVSAVNSSGQSGNSNQASATPQVQSKIQHVVVIFQENRTPDNLFHGLPNADIANSGTNSAGQTIPLTPVGLAK